MRRGDQATMCAARVPSAADRAGAAEHPHHFTPPMLVTPTPVAGTRMREGPRGKREGRSEAGKPAGHQMEPSRN